MASIAGLSEPPIVGDREMMRPAQEFLRIDRTKQLESYAFFNFIGLGQ